MGNRNLCRHRRASIGEVQGLQNFLILKHYMSDFCKTVPCPRTSSRDEQLWRNVLRISELCERGFSHSEAMHSDTVSLDLLAVVRCVKVLSLRVGKEGISLEGLLVVVEPDLLFGHTQLTRLVIVPVSQRTSSILNLASTVQT